MGPVEQPEGRPGVAQPPADHHLAVGKLIQPGGHGGEEGAVVIHKAVGKGQADQTAVGMAAEGQVHAAAFVQRPVVPVGQQDDVGAAQLGADLGHELGQGLLVGKAVGVVDARKDHGLAVPLQRHVFVGQHRHPAGGHGLLDAPRRRHAQRPLVVAGDVIGGGDSRKAPAQRLHHGKVGVILVDEVAGDSDEVGPLGRHGGQQLLIVPAKFGAVDVGHHGDAEAREGLRQLFVRYGDLLRAEAGLLPVKPAAEPRQQGKNKQNHRPAAFSGRFSRHR